MTIVRWVRQLCVVDFVKAFDLINRHILFYKTVKCGWYGLVNDTMQRLYSKIHFGWKITTA